MHAFDKGGEVMLWQISALFNKTNTTKSSPKGPHLECGSLLVWPRAEEWMLVIFSTYCDGWEDIGLAESAAAMRDKANDAQHQPWAGSDSPEGNCLWGGSALINLFVAAQVKRRLQSF